MRDRVAFFANDEKDQKILTAVHFIADKKVLGIWTVPDKSLSDELRDQILHKWIDGQQVAFPEGHIFREWPLSASSFLPDDIKPERPEKVKIIQNEWTLKLLSIQLYELMRDEIELMAKKVSEAESYAQEQWDEAKTIWERVLEHMKENNLTKDHKNKLKESINVIFEDLKVLKKEANKELIEASAANLTLFKEKIQAIEEKVNPKNRLNDLFEELRKIQSESNRADFIAKEKKIIRDYLDQVFKKIKSERDNLWKNRTAKRLEGLHSAIERMEKSLAYDIGSRDYQQKKINSPTANQLEQQLRITKIKVLDDRIKGKQEKLEDMQRTLEKLKKQVPKNKPKKEAAKEPGKPATAKTDTKAVKEPGKPATAEADTKAAKEPGKPATAEADTKAAKEPGKPATTEAVTKAAKEPGKPATAEAETKAATEPGKPGIAKADKQATKSSESPAQKMEDSPGEEKEKTEVLKEESTPPMTEGSVKPEAVEAKSPDAELSEEEINKEIPNSDEESKESEK